MLIVLVILLINGPLHGKGDTINANGTAVTHICQSCCTSNTYCGKTTTDNNILNGAGGLTTGASIPAGTDLTCYMQNRSQSNAADAGLCIPQLEPALSGSNLATFCQLQAGSVAVSNILYQQMSSVTASQCQPCCNGDQSCGPGFTCYANANSSGGHCVPYNVALVAAYSIPSFCSDVSLSTSPLECESCVRLSQDASVLAQSIQSFAQITSNPSQTASTTGQAVSDSGQTVSNAGQSLTDAGGQAASDVGQIASNEGQAVSNSAQASQATPSPSNPGQTTPNPFTPDQTTSATSATPGPTPFNPYSSGHVGGPGYG